MPWADVQTHPPSKTHGNAGSVLKGRSLLCRVCLLIRCQVSERLSARPRGPNELPGGHPSSLRGGTKRNFHACQPCGPPFLLSRRGVCVCTHPRPPAQRRWPPVSGPDGRWTPGAACCTPAVRDADDSGPSPRVVLPYCRGSLPGDALRRLAGRSAYPARRDGTDGRLASSSHTGATPVCQGRLWAGKISL